MVAALAQAGRAATTVDVALDLQVASRARALPPRALFEGAVAAALATRRARGEVTLRIVDADEGRALNRRWRGRDYATNVLSFPVEGLAEIAPDLLGDIVLCAPVVAAEAVAQGKRAADHWTHLTVHGVLHLLGYDHEVETEALVMEDQERAILASLGVADPYRG